MDSQPIPRPRPAGWIISPAADIALLVATPLAILPAVTLAARHLSTDMIVLGVAAFASIGHHLPGFLRAYGDRELFRRFRWRFLLAPPLVLAAALVFAWHKLHGLDLIVLMWATWHIIMQTYGLMRIYDLKRGIRDATTARLDLAACLAVFVAGIALSQPRLFTILETAQQVGLPLGPPAMAVALHWTAWGAVVVLLAAYAIHAWRRARVEGATWLKLALLATTGWLYWSCGSLSTNLLIGVAMFEIFHAVQYYAIVWSYNRRLAARDGDRLGWLRFMFTDGWPPLAIYAAAIFTFGSIRWTAGGLDPSLTRTLLMAFLLTSTVMHFYFDGFIWKVSEAGTQQNLGIQGNGRLSATASAGMHGAKWAAVTVLAAGLFWIETRQPPQSAADQRAWFAAVSAWTPDVPDLLLHKGRFALADGDSTVALEASQRLVQIRPDWVDAYVLLARSANARHDFHAADLAARRAVALAPESADANYQLGLANVQLRDFATAERALHDSITADAKSAPTHLQLGNVYFLTRRLPAAERSFRRATELDPTFAEAHGNLGAVLMAEGQVAAAKQSLLAALATSDNPQCHYNLGLILLVEGAMDEARTHLQRAESLGQAIPPEVRRDAGL